MMISLQEIKSYIVNEFKDTAFNPDGPAYVQNRVSFVYSTWVAIQSTAVTELFAQTVKNNATLLACQQIPYVVFYSRIGMTKEEEAKMTFEHNNVFVVCMDDIAPVSSKYKADLELLDYLRLHVVKHFYTVKCFLINLFPLFCQLTTYNRGNSMMYIDMDIEFIGPIPEYIHTYKGLASYPLLYCLFSSATGNEDVLLGDPHFAYQYVLSGRAYADARREYLRLERDYEPVIARGENCMLCINFDALHRFQELVHDSSCIVDFHCNPNYRYLQNSDPLYKEHHTYMYLQLLRVMFHRGDRSWHNKTP
ncbi:hypothetical protein ECIV_ORF53 [European chub iridovirus]|nr:hypothetical protein ECIV_ORF53 [European chub iridovirus]